MNYNKRMGHRGFVMKIINSVSGLLEVGKIQILESVTRTLEERILLLQRLDGEMLEGLKEEQEICNERSSNIRPNIQETVFQIDSKLKEISISEERSSSNSVNFNVNSNANGFWRTLLKPEIIQTVNFQILS